jgi:threonine dehydrogenase-like Zn-dependent dehydrogenase
MRRAVWTEDGLSVDDVDPGPLGDGMVRLRVEACGICGTDLKFWAGHQHPIAGTVPGHEFVGVVLAGPQGLADERYAASPIVVCGTCEFCATAQWNLCRRGGDLIGLGRDGGLAEWVDVPARNLTVMPEVLAPSVAMLAEPMAVAVRGVGHARLDADDRVLVLGAGTIGLLTAAVARTRSSDVTISARYPHQRAAAAALGIAVIGDDEALAWGKQSRPSTVFETVGGSGGTLDTAIAVARRGGTIVVLGTFANIPVDLFAAGQKELVFRNSFAYGTTDGRSDFADAAQALVELREPVAALVTDRFGLGSVADAFACAADKHTGAIKVAVEMS